MSSNPEETLVLLARFGYPHEYLVMRTKLEDEGIDCFVFDENTVQMYSFYSNALGGIRFCVRQSDYERAKEILLEFFPEKKEES